MLTAPSLVCQRCSSNCLKRSGSMPSTAYSDRPAISAEPASSALSWTGRCLSAQSAMIVGKRVMRYGSTHRAVLAFAHLARSMKASIAATLVSLASAALPMAVVTALQEVLSVCSRSVFEASDHEISSGSLDIFFAVFLNMQDG